MQSLHLAQQKVAGTACSHWMMHGCTGACMFHQPGMQLHRLKADCTALVPGVLQAAAGGQDLTMGNQNNSRCN